MNQYRPTSPVCGAHRYALALEFSAYANQFYNDTAAQKVFQNHMLKVMNRKNTVSGRVYKNELSPSFHQSHNLRFS